MTAKPIRTWRRPLCALLALALLTASSARANDEPSGTVAGEADAEKRLSAELDAALRSEGARAFTWRVTWTAIYGAVAVASIGGAFILPREQRPSMIIGAISAGVSTAYSWFLPLAVEADAERAEQISGASDAARAARLRELYEHSAKDQSDRVRWPWHVFAIVSAAIPAAIIWIGYDQPEEAAFSFVGGVVLGELQLLTQPTRLRDNPLPESGTLRVVVTGREALCLYTLRL